MRITKLGHACLLVAEQGARLLIDPGIYTAHFETLADIDAVLITHSHADHVDRQRLAALLAASPTARVVADGMTADQLRADGFDAVAVAAGDRLDLAGAVVDVHGVQHTPIHPAIPVVANVGYLIGGRLFHPGDSFTLPESPVEILALPVAGPWLKLGEAIDHLTRARPAVAIPIHEAVLARPALSISYVTQHAPDGTEVITLDVGETLDR